MHDLPGSDNIVVCVLGTGSCLFIQAAERFMPDLLHIIFPPILPQIATLLAAGITILAGYPHAKAQVKKFFKRFKR